MKSNISIKSKMVFLFLSFVINISSLRLAHAESWDKYLDNLVDMSKDSFDKLQCDKAGIIGLNDGRLWYDLSRPHALRLTTAEAQTIAQAMESGNVSSLYANGIFVEGVKYQFISLIGKVALAKKKGHGALTIQKSNTAVVIGHTLEGGQQGNTNRAVESIAEYLESVGM